MQRGQTDHQPKWRVTGDQQSTYTYQNMGHTGNPHAAYSELNLGAELAKQSGDYVKAVMSPSVLRNGLDSINVSGDQVGFFSRYLHFKISASSTKLMPWSSQ